MLSSLPCRILALSLLAVGLLATAAHGGAPKASEADYDALVEAAVDARQSGDLVKSAELLRKAHALDPSPELMNNLGRVLEELGKYREAYETYRSVANDGSADRSLRALDAGRMAALQPRIGRAWIVLTVTPEGATVFLDGASVGATAAGGEHATGPARTTLEIHLAEASEIVLRQPAPPIGERSVHFEDAATIAPTDARLDFAGITPAPTAVTVDGQALMGDLTQRPTVRLPAGEHKVGLTLPGFEPEEHVVTVAPEGTVAIAPLLVRRSTAPVEVWEFSHAPWITAASGVVVMGVGAGLHVAAKADQDGISSDISQKKARDLDESAQSLGAAGLATLLVGAAASVGGAIWWILHESNRPDEASTAALPWIVPTRGGATTGLHVTW